MRFYKHPFITKDDFGIMAKVEKLSESGPTGVYLNELSFIRDELGLDNDEIDDLMSRIVTHAEETQAISPGNHAQWMHFSASVDHLFTKVFPFNQVPSAYLYADAMTNKGTKSVSTCIAQLAAYAYYNNHKKDPSK